MHLKANHSYKSTLLLLALLTYPPLTFAADVAHETQGLKFTVLPLAGFSSDDGPGYGIKTNLYDYDGSTVPYRIAISAQAFFTTKGKWSHRFKIDFPEFRPGNRVEFDFRYDKEDFTSK